MTGQTRYLQRIQEGKLFDASKASAVDSLCVQFHAFKAEFSRV